jgi:antitoxin component YwqK of YwqJK toxin-antitoxin module
VKEEAVGKWQTFHWNGALASEVFYVNSAQTQSVWDSLGRQQVTHGNGKYTAWFPNGVVKEEGQYINGVKTGEWRGYTETGAPYFKEEWLDNRLVRGISLGERGAQYIYDQSSFYPTPVIGRAKFNEYLEKNVRSARDARDGIVKLLFTVGADGELWNFVVLQSSCNQCNDEAIRLVREGPAWRPALSHGQEKVQSVGYAEVKFKP